MLIKTGREVDVLCVVTRRSLLEEERHKLKIVALNVKCFLVRVPVLKYTIHTLATDALPCLNSHVLCAVSGRIMVYLDSALSCLKCGVSFARENSSELPGKIS